MQYIVWVALEYTLNSMVQALSERFWIDLTEISLRIEAEKGKKRGNGKKMGGRGREKQERKGEGKKKEEPK